MRDMIGSYKSRHVSGDPSAEGAQGGGGGRLACETQLQVRSQQEELERLRKDLSSQKVTSVLVCLCPPPVSHQHQRARPGFRGSRHVLFPRGTPSGFHAAGGACSVVRVGLSEHERLAGPAPLHRW